MSDPIFESQTARFGLPLLFSGQSQKEGHVNEALARIDAVLHGAIEAELPAPPAAVSDGQTWLVASNPSGAWAGQAGKIAAQQSGNWLFIAPRDGMKLLNRASGQELRYAGGWKSATRPAPASGGTTIDAEARATISALLTCLTLAGIFPTA